MLVNYRPYGNSIEHCSRSKNNRLHTGAPKRIEFQVAPALIGAVFKEPESSVKGLQFGQEENKTLSCPTCPRVSTAGEFEHSGQQGPLSARLGLPSSGKLIETLVAQTGDFIRVHHVSRPKDLRVAANRHDGRASLHGKHVYACQCRANNARTMQTSCLLHVAWRQLEET